MKTQNEFEKNITKDIHIKILEDSLNDVRTKKWIAEIKVMHETW